MQSKGMVISLTPIYNFGMWRPIGAFCQPLTDFSPQPQPPVSCPLGRALYFFSTLGNKWADMTYIDLMLAWDMMVGLGGLKITQNQSFVQNQAVS